jgi:hypothetical protein
MQGASFLPGILFSSVSCLAVRVFPLHLIDGKIFGEKVIQYKFCVLIFPTPFSALI